MKPVYIAFAVASVIFAAVLAGFLLVRPSSSRGEAPRIGARGPEEAPPATPRVDVTKSDPRRSETSSAIAHRAEEKSNVDDGGPRGTLPIPRGSATLVFELSDAAGKPVSRAAVTLLRGRSAQTTPCDRHGLSVFVDIEAGTYTFTVAAEGVPELVSAKEISLSDGEERRVPLTIDPYALGISGRVLDRGGTPVAGIKVEARRQLSELVEGALLRSDQESLVATSDRGGRYEISRLDAADYVLRTEATDGYPSATKVYRAGSRSADIVLEEARLLAVHGTVASKDGQALAGVRIQPLGQSTHQVETGQDGTFELDVEILEGQSVQVLAANKAGYRETRVNLRMDEARGEDRLELNLVMDELGARASFAGTISDGEKNPVGGETVYLHSSSLNARYQTTSDARGRFKLSDVQVGGDYRLWIYPRQGFKDFQKTPVEVPESGAELEIVLESIATGGVRGRMVDSQGRPVPSFTLWLKSLKALGSSVAVTGNEAGQFEAENVPEGELLLETRSLPRLTVRGVQFAPSDPTDLEIVLDWGGNAFSGTVTDPGGVPIAGARVSLYWSQRFEKTQSSSFRSAVTDASGTFSFSELGPGEHKINVVSDSHSPGQAMYDVGSGATEPTIRLAPKPAR
jgi:protocatechuate 3,4-dioxygenase beta subunit